MYSVELDSNDSRVCSVKGSIIVVFLYFGRGVREYIILFFPVFVNVYVCGCVIARLTHIRLDRRKTN